MAYRLPPLSTLRLFEAAARLSSFKAAAEELHVTPSAVSHGVQSLEQWLGLRLFVRGTRTLTLTKDGTAFLPQVQQALSLLATAVESLPGRRARGRLSISAAPTFASRWLVTQLPRFQALHPEIQVAIDTQFRQVDFPRDGVDLAIRLGIGPWPGLDAMKLLDEVVVPVCAPELAQQIRRVEDLATTTLLRVASASHDWDRWFEAAGQPPVTPKRTLVFDTIHMALDAAARGLGVVLGRHPLFHEELASGLLVPVLGPPRRFSTAYWLVTSPDYLRRPEVAAFRSWIKQVIREVAEAESIAV